MQQPLTVPSKLALHFPQLLKPVVQFQSQTLSRTKPKRRQRKISLRHQHPMPQHPKVNPRLMAWQHQLNQRRKGNPHRPLLPNQRVLIQEPRSRRLALLASSSSRTVSAGLETIVRSHIHILQQKMPHLQKGLHPKVNQRPRPKLQGGSSGSWTSLSTNNDCNPTNILVFSSSRCSSLG